jgi:hypothetical protein
VSTLNLIKIKLVCGPVISKKRVNVWLFRDKEFTEAG